MDVKFNFAALQGLKQQEYDNNGAHAEVVKMMNRGDKLSVSFGMTTTQHPCAWVESKKVAKFKYELDAERTGNLINYMMNGVVCDYAGDPMKSDTLGEGEDFQFEMMKTFIEKGLTLQYVPPFREYLPQITAMKAMFKGTITFHVSRTPKTLDYLREHEQDV